MSQSRVEICQSIKTYSTSVSCNVLNNPQQDFDADRPPVLSSPVGMSFRFPSRFKIYNDNVEETSGESHNISEQSSKVTRQRSKISTKNCVETSGESQNIGGHSSKVIGQSPKIGIVISHGRSMTLEDKLNHSVCFDETAESERSGSKVLNNDHQPKWKLENLLTESEADTAFCDAGGRKRKGSEMSALNIVSKSEASSRTSSVLKTLDSNVEVRKSPGQKSKRFHGFTIEDIMSVENHRDSDSK